MRDSILCQTCANLQASTSHEGSRRERRRCAAGVRLPYPTFECESYVRLFTAAPGIAGIHLDGA